MKIKKKKKTDKNTEFRTGIMTYSGDLILVFHFFFPPFEWDREIGIWNHSSTCVITSLYVIISLCFSLIYLELQCPQLLKSSEGLMRNFCFNYSAKFWQFIYFIWGLFLQKVLSIWKNTVSYLITRIVLIHFIFSSYRTCICIKVALKELLPELGTARC